MEKKSFFITLYTDASVRPLENKAQVAWRGKCSEGTILGNKEIRFTKDTARAEIKAIREAIAFSLAKFPSLEGFFINCDNMEVCRYFWSFVNKKTRYELEDVKTEIEGLLRGRWLRIKHVKAHTGRGDVRSYMNRQVDKATRSQTYKKFKEGEGGK